MAKLPKERLRGVEVEVNGELSPQCVICREEQAKKQYLLPCLHSYGLCRKAGCKEAVEKASRVTCTTCQSRFSSIKAEVHYFATRLLKEKEVGGPYCWQCEKEKRGIKAATCYCAHVSCFNYLCEECRDSHADSPVTEDHIVELLWSEDFRDRSMVPWLRSNDLFCGTHKGKKRDIFCQNCEDLICSRCSEVEPHRSHPVTDINKELCERMRAQIRLSGDLVASQLPKVVNAREHVEQRLAELATNSTEAQSQINNDFDAIQAQLRTRREELLQEVERVYHEKITALTEQSEELAAATAQLRGFSGNIRQAVSKGSVEGHFTLRRAATQRSEELMQHVERLKLDPVRDNCVAYWKKGSPDVQGAIKAVGEIQDSTYSKNDFVAFVQRIFRNYSKS